jgi:lipopolysaccharide transport system ATP-binding protein
MKPILEVRNLWKQYKIGGQQTSYLSLREKLLQPFKKQSIEAFWALKGIDFEINQGECIGIVGKNGAGKSTLLKILSQITPPTKGYIKARGRIASLLEVGTGFHPELTGRENIFLNGSILGLKRTEINAKFDEIVDFSGIGKFLDTPLKHYSSGMRLRLAFSVAAHLEPEILLIDEVLAVGDSEFQKKCLGKMDEVSKSGRTVLFVSHNLGAVKQLCTRGVLLENGTLKLNSSIDEVINAYNINTGLLDNAIIEDIIQIKDVLLKDKNNQRSNLFLNSQNIIISLEFAVLRELEGLKFNLFITKDGVEVLNTFHNDIVDIDFTLGHYQFELTLPNFLLNEGTYFIGLSISQHQIRWIRTLENITSFKISFNPINSHMTNMNKRKSIIAPMINWDRL